MSALSLTEADVLAARREMAKKSLRWFAGMVDIPTVPISEQDDEDRFHTMRVDRMAKHHELLLDDLQAIADGSLIHDGEPVRRLMYFMPPGSAKSTYIDVAFIPWLMGRTKRYQAILACYASNLAAKQGRRARQLINSKSYQLLFPGVTLDPTKTAADEWNTTNGGEFMAGGILSGIGGNRCNAMIIDDPIAGREAADSEAVRKKTYEEYEDTLRMRLKPSGITILVTTRWHERDPAGMLLPEDWKGESGVIKCRDGNYWLVRRVPAKCDSEDDPLGRKIGDYLWPEYLGERHFKQFEATHRTWSSLCQGLPAPETGTFLDIDKVQRINPPAKAKMRIIAASDYATKDGSGDYTVHGIGGIDEDDMLHLLAVWRRQTETNVWVDQMLAMGRQWEPLEWGEPDDIIIKSVSPDIERQMSRTGVYFTRERYPNAGDKMTKARTLQARNERGKFAIAPDAPFANDVMSEMSRFGGGATHDDIVDMLAVLAKVAAKIGPPDPPPEESTQQYRGLGGSHGWQTL